MKIPTLKNGLDIPSIKGPFLVECFVEWDVYGHDGKWMARILPTGDKFKGKLFKTHEECCAYADGLFERRLRDWKMHEPAVMETEGSLF